jgi:ketosteroid isomerase-like protein
MTDLDELKAAFDQAVATFNDRDLETWATFNHDQVVFFSPASPFAIDGKSGVLQAMQGLLANSDSIAWKIINPQFRVIGSTGVTWGHYSFSVKPKDGPLRTEFARFLLTWAKVDRQWRIVAEHNSRIPSGA